MDDDNEGRAFKDALKSFTFSAASGDAIAHLAGHGYIPRQMCGMLDFPTPYERIREAYWDYLLENRIVVRNYSDIFKRKKKVSYVTVLDGYGRRSFRQVVEDEGATGTVSFEELKKVKYEHNVHGGLKEYLKGLSTKKSESRQAYVSCDFGRMTSGELEDLLAPLEEALKGYVLDVQWEKRMVWHLLDERMIEIVSELHFLSQYHCRVIAVSRGEIIEL